MYTISFQDSANLNLATWNGFATTARGRIGLVVTDQVTLSKTSFDDLEVLINTSETDMINGLPPNTCKYLHNGVAIGGTNPFSHAVGAGNAISRIVISREANGGTVNEFITVDDIRITRCTQQCQDPVFDVRDTSNAVVADGKITTHDFNAFAACSTKADIGAAVFDALSFECRCMDADGDLDVDVDDFGKFQRCFTGPAGTVDVTCDD
jgi:hypothetical protein